MAIRLGRNVFYKSGFVDLVNSNFFVQVHVQAYANNDLVDVDETENVNDLKKKLKSADRNEFITRQKWLNTVYSNHKKTKVAC